MHPLQKKETGPVVLCLLDGWGQGSNTEENAIAQAKKPVWDRLSATSPHVLLKASEEAVGLPKGQMGNSEVGHLTIGAGRVLLQDLPKINRDLADKSIFSIPPFQQFVSTLRKNRHPCHILGLFSDGGVHASLDHILHFANFLAEQGIPVWIHGFLDGRDTAPGSALKFLRDGADFLEKNSFVRWGTLGGRYFSMDRDHRWDRTKKAYDAMVFPSDFQQDPLLHVEACLSQGITDEFIHPFCVEGYPGIAAGDGMIMMNFRTDRVRQLAHALFDPDFQEFFHRPLGLSSALSLTPISDAVVSWVTPLYPHVPIKNTLGQVVSDQGLRQLRLAETEKYAHVTFFLGGGMENPLPKEERVLVPSPSVATYDLSPAMGAPAITQHAVEALQKNSYDLLVINYANADMVGHTGDFDATVQAIQVLDSCIGELEKIILEKDGFLILTADHGNAECMRQYQEKGMITHTAHTCNPVPCLLVGKRARGFQCIPEKFGGLCDIAPTILSLLNLPIPSEMTGVPLFQVKCV